MLLRGPLDRGYFGARRWTASNPFTAPTFRYVLAQDSDEDVKVEVLDATGEVLWQTDGPTEAGYHEITWGRGGRGGRGGQRGFGGFGGRRGGGSRGPTAGTFAVRISRGNDSSVMAFHVHDRRGASDALGSWPGELFDEGADASEHGSDEGGEEAAEAGEGRVR